MLTDSKLLLQIDALWGKFWTEGLSNRGVRLRKSGIYEPPLDMFGADAVERWFTEKEVKEVVEFANKMAV